MAPIKVFLHRMRLKNTSNMDVHEGKIRFVALGLYKPIPVPKGTAKDLASQIQIRSVDALRKHLLKLQILQEAADGTEHARLRIDPQTLDRYWDEFALVWKPPSGRHCLCSCWFFQWHGHCVHQYSVEIFWQMRNPLPQQLPHATTALIRAKTKPTQPGSDDELLKEHPRKRRRTTGTFNKN